MTKLSKFLLLIIVCTVFLLMNKCLTGIWHAIFDGGVIGWASIYFVNSIDEIVTMIRDNS